MKATGVRAFNVAWLFIGLTMGALAMQGGLWKVLTRSATVTPPAVVSTVTSVTSPSLVAQPTATVPPPTVTPATIWQSDRATARRARGAASARHEAMASHWDIGPTATLAPTELPPAPSPTSTRTRRPTRTLTPTPVFVLLSDEKTLWRYVRPTRTPIPTPPAVPRLLQGRIAFRSALLGSSGKRILVVNPDGSELAYLPNRWAYDRQCDRDRLSPDGAYAVIQAEGRHGLDLFVMALPGGSTSQLTFVGKGKAYDPAWSPDGRRIVFASNQETDDDIFVVEFGDPRAPRPRTIKLTHDDWESDKHPSYSPDGTQIVFCSNKSGRRQIWVMNADGSEPRQLVDIDADCWDPVWIKP